MSHDCTNETCRRPTCLPCVTSDLEAARTCMFEAERQLAEERQEVELKSRCIAGMRRDLDDMEKKWATAVAFGCVIESERDQLRAELEECRRERAAMLDALDIAADVEHGRDPVEACKEQRDQLDAYLDRDGQDFVRQFDALTKAQAERDTAIARANLEAAHHEHLRRERDEARAERDAWRNCFICLQCGRGSADEDGCCTTCGLGCLIFEDGRLVNDTMHDALDADAQRESAAMEREQIASWLESWEPDYYASAADNNGLSTDAVLLLAAERIRAGAHKKGSE